jgi:putative exporter of polyketide antibiotics
MFHQVNGPGIFEIAFIGGLFSISSFIHSVWAIKMILKEAKQY